MRTKFCLVRECGSLGVDSFVYVVWVGSSVRDSVKLGLVQEFCKDVGWYFKKWSPLVDSSLENRTRLIRSCGDPTVKPFRFLSISIAECYQTILDDSWAELHAKAEMSPQEIRHRFHHTIAYNLRQNLRNCNTSCPPSVRKYLSRRHQPGFYNVVGGVTLAILIFILDAIITPILETL